MTQEMIAIIGTNIALAGLILHSGRNTDRALAVLRKEMAGLRMEMTKLCECMARPEGSFEEFTGRKPPVAAE